MHEMHMSNKFANKHKVVLLNQVIFSIVYHSNIIETQRIWILCWTSGHETEIFLLGLQAPSLRLL